SIRENLSHISVTPDGRAIIAQRAQPSSQLQVVRIPVDGGDPLVLVDGATPNLTPDGSEVVYTVGGRVLAVPIAGGTPRTVREVPAPEINILRTGDDHRVHMMAVLPRGFEAWSAPIGGGAAAREVPAPWSMVDPAPRSGWRALIALGLGNEWRARLLPPGA